MARVWNDIPELHDAPTLQIFTAKLQPHYSQTTVSQIELQPLTVHSDWL